MGAILDFLFSRFERHNKNMPQKPPLPKGYLTTAQAADRLGISEQAVRNLIGRDKLPARWIGRWIVRESDVAQYNPRPRGRPKK